MTPEEIPMLDKNNTKTGEPDGSHLYCRLAAFIDGEGSISIERTSPSPRLQRRSSPRYQSYIRVTNTNELLMFWLVEHFGGSYRIRKRDKATHKYAFVWTVGDRGAYDVLRHTRDLLVLKRPQCENSMAFTEGYKDSRGNSHASGRGIAREELERRHAHYLVSRKLNRRGVAPAETKREGASEDAMR